MSRRRITLVQHADRSFDDVCWILERHADEVLTAAGGSAVDEATRLADDTGGVPHFDPHARPTVTVGAVSRSRPNQIALTVRWHGDPNKQFLPNVDAQILGTREGRTSTRIEILASHAPSAPTRRANLEFVARRIVRGSLTRFVERLVDELEGFEEHALA